MTGAVPDIPGISPELVVHLFVAATGPDAADGYGWLRGIWANCHRLAGLDESLPTDGLGVAVALDPPSARPLADEAEVPLAGRQRGSAEVAQAVLRRRRDAFCLSAVLTPAVDTDDSWAAFDAMWDMVVGDDPPPALLGEARIYQGCLREPAAGDAGPASVKEGAAVPATLARWGPALHTINGLDAWDLGDAGRRPIRRIAVIAPAGSDGALSAWTWTDGGLALPPLGRYLLSAAKVRYESRLREVARPRARAGALSDAARALAALAAGRTGGQDREALAAARDEVRAWDLEAVCVLADLRDLTQTVQIAIDNLRAANSGAGGALFAADDRAARWLLTHLADDCAALESARERARATAQAAGPCPDGPDAVGDDRTASMVEQDPRADSLLSDRDLDALVDELATVFGLGIEADRLLDRVGYPRARRHWAAGARADVVWWEIVRDMSNGAVHRPVRRLLEAALADLPFNEIFNRLAAE